MKTAADLYEELKENDFLLNEEAKEEDLQLLEKMIKKYGYWAAEERAARIFF